MDLHETNVGRCWPFEGAQGQLSVRLSQIVQALLVGDGLSATCEELMWMPSMTRPVAADAQAAQFKASATLNFRFCTHLQATFATRCA